MTVMNGLVNVGDTLAGKYRVEKILGIGGMGMVVAAMHTQIDQMVAIKLMLPAALESPEASARFLREARAVGRLTNEHICRVTDIGTLDNGAPYIVMEYMEGYDLGTLLKRRGPMQVAQAVDFIMQACEGMAEAHSFGIVHRDLKPDNLFLASRVDGAQIVKVLDFGISKAAVTGIETRTGDVMGSPAYMAPEQMQSTKDVDARADIWSLGVVLYQIISGRMPFVADTLPALCLSVINDQPPSLAAIRKDLPPGLAEVVMQCLAKKREDRFPNVATLAQALQPFAGPDAIGSITRIRSMLQRKRQPTPPPLMMLPSEFSDVVAPTITTTSDSLDIPAPIPPSQERRAITTAGASAGESVELRKRGLPLGLLGAIAGTAALIALIVVMAMMKKGANADSKPEPPPAAASLVGEKSDKAEPPPKPEPKAEVKAEPKIEPIAEDKKEPALVPVKFERDEKDYIDDTRHQLRKKHPDLAQKLEQLTKDAEEGKATKEAVLAMVAKGGEILAKDKRAAASAGSSSRGATQAPGSAAGSAKTDDDPDSKWGHMTHDGPSKLLPTAGSGSN